MRSVIGIAILMISFATSALAQNPIPDRRLALLRNFDLPGGDIQSIFDTTLTACQAACLADDNCQAFTFNTKSNACFPKLSIGEREAYDGAFSGFILETPANVVALGEERAKDLGFLREKDIEAATSLATSLTNKHVPNDWTVEDLLQSAADAGANGNIVSAHRFTGAATVLTDAADHWVEYGRLALAIQTDKSAEKRTYQERALSAAINGYLRAETGPIQANALLIIADALEKRARGRTSIDALRLANVMAPRQDTEELLDKAIAKYGFRITDHQIESNPAPRGEPDG